MCKFRHKYLDEQINRELFIDKNKRTQKYVFVCINGYIYTYIMYCIYMCLFIYMFIYCQKQIINKRFDEKGKKKKNKVYIYTNTYMYIK